jgi:hypothetical protein
MTAVLVCLALAFGPVMAAGRTADRSGDRAKPTSRGNDATDMTQSEQVTRIVHEGRIAAENNTHKAAGLLSAATQQDGNDAIATLNQILGMDLPSSPENDKLLAGVNSRLADLYEGSAAKQVQLLSIALQYTSDPAARGRIESRITGLGGDVFSMQFRGGNTAVTRDAGPDDTCDGATPAAASETMNIFPSGDANWRSITVGGPLGESYRLETVSDTPGAFDDDTDLTLYGSCTAGVPGDFIAFNDDGSGVNAPFMSRIDTDCLAPGTYYLEVGGFSDISTPDNFDLEVEVTGTCVLPVADDYESDDDRGDAVAIGHPTSTPAHANGWGRAKKEIQARTLFPAGDRDHAEFSLTRNELVRMGTSGQFPTFFNGFEAISGGTDIDTIMELRYHSEHNYGGRCNEPDIGFINVCFTDQDCIDACGGSFPCNGSTIGGFPPCMALYFFNVPFLTEDGLTHSNVLAVNDDRGGGAFTSELLLCLPRTQPGSDSSSVNGDWLVRVDPWSPTLTFNYELQVKNEVQCTFEVEPNGDLNAPNHLTLGDTVHGFFDFSTTFPDQDSDLWAFDVDEDQLVTLETDGYDGYACDTYFQLIVGPDDGGDFYLVASDDDGGAIWLSKLEFILPPASDLLGNVTADADYILNVTSAFLNPNFPYTLNTSAADLPTVHVEGDDTCAGEGAANPVAIGDSVIAEINPTCDFDAYKLSLSGSAFVSVATTGGGDTTIQLVDCGDNSVLACDDDGGPGLLSLVQGCLPAGDYCVRVRAFSGFATFNYGLEVSGAAGCTPTNPPTVIGDGLFTCASGYDVCP